MTRKCLVLILMFATCLSARSFQDVELTHREEGTRWVFSTRSGSYELEHNGTPWENQRQTAGLLETNFEFCRGCEELEVEYSPFFYPSIEGMGPKIIEALSECVLDGDPECPLNSVIHIDSPDEFFVEIWADKPFSEVAWILIRGLKTDSGLLTIFYKTEDVAQRGNHWLKALKNLKFIPKAENLKGLKTVNADGISLLIPEDWDVENDESCTRISPPSEQGQLVVSQSYISEADSDDRMDEAIDRFFCQVDGSGIYTTRSEQKEQFSLLSGIANLTLPNREAAVFLFSEGDKHRYIACIMDKRHADEMMPIFRDIMLSKRPSQNSFRRQLRMGGR